jgi:hypothetical protein
MRLFNLASYTRTVNSNIVVGTNELKRFQIEYFCPSWQVWLTETRRKFQFNMDKDIPTTSDIVRLVFVEESNRVILAYVCKQSNVKL